MTKLRLGPIAEDRPVKLTIELPGALLRALHVYAKAHARETQMPEPLPPERLIVPMVECFIEGDRAFRKHRRNEPG